MYSASDIFLAPNPWLPVGAPPRSVHYFELLSYNEFVSFVANGLLSFSVAFPIITSAPGLVAALWGVFVFGEIAGRRNYAILALAATLNITAAVLIALSR